MYIILGITSPKVCRHFCKQYIPVCRSISLLNRLKPSSVLLDKSKHEIVYEFPYIVQTSYIIRTKIWVPAIMALVAPVGFLFDGFRYAIVGGILGSFVHFGSVHIFSKCLASTIGKIYVSKEEDCSDLIISSIDSFGNRIDRKHKLNDLIFCGFPSKMSMKFGFICIVAQDENVKYKMNVNSYKIHNMQIFSTLFGENWFSQDELYKTKS